MMNTAGILLDYRLITTLKKELIKIRLEVLRGYKKHLTILVKKLVMLDTLTPEDILTGRDIKKKNFLLIRE